MTKRAALTGDHLWTEVLGLVLAGVTLEGALQPTEHPETSGLVACRCHLLDRQTEEGEMWGLDAQMLGEYQDRS